VSLRAELQAVVDTLSKRPERELSLDSICDVVGAMAITSDEIGLIFDALEASGKSIAQSPVTARESLRQVLQSARSLKQELGRNPTSAEIAARSGLDLDSVRLGLLYAALLQR